ncbi:hypothetical protein BDP27DRAFT_1437162 [Rhodocollybia butyracea]|uniref:Uncharacterized protein n=1 Tax=Rhodocollybia butyracea TaxID=206335 RepID=A0A9P5P4Y6_9AGAR|nr:hypothetical protein BDP27DRAFT_1437162 [Rhodocollybia butyracea]
MAYVIGAISVTVLDKRLRIALLTALYGLFWEYITLQFLPIPGTLKGEERSITVRHRNPDIASLTWLGFYTSNPSAKSVLCQSLGAFPSKISEKLGKVTDELQVEGWLRAGIHLRSSIPAHCIKENFHPLYESTISDHNCNIASALSALAFGLSPVKFVHAGQCIELTAEDAINWVLATYKEGPPLDLPGLVWESLLVQISGNISFEYLVFAIRRYSGHTVSSTIIQDLISSDRAQHSRTPSFQLLDESLPL